MTQPGSDQAENTKSTISSDIKSGDKVSKREVRESEPTQPEISLTKSWLYFRFCIGHSSKTATFYREHHNRGAAATRQHHTTPSFLHRSFMGDCVSSKFCWYVFDGGNCRARQHTDRRHPHRYPPDISPCCRVDAFRDINAWHSSGLFYCRIGVDAAFGERI